MKSLAFLLLLDYSGSMEQKLDKTPKIQIIKEQVGALLSTGEPDRISEALIFGTEPKKGCQDVLHLKSSNTQMGKKVRQLNPGAYGKTPLTEGFRQLVDRLKSGTATKAVVVTDGADTCGEDPCEFLAKVDKTIKTEHPYEIFMVGLDLKEDKPQMECFKKLKLTNFNIHFSEIRTKEDLLNQLHEAQLPQTDIENEIKDSMRTGSTQIKLFKLKSKSKKTNRPGQEQSAHNEEKTAYLEITGAPTSAQFHSENETNQRSWQGPFSISLPAGEYRIQFLDEANGGEIKFKLAPGILTKIPWAQLMKFSTGEIEITTPSLTLQWTPDSTTKAIHGDIKNRDTLADLNESKVEIPPLPFGKWTVEITSPAWLVKRIQPKSLSIENRHLNALNLKEIFAGEVNWITVPKSDTGQVMVLQDPDSKEERHYIPPGQKELPIPANYKVRWLQP
jgi:hypothetical protein